MIESDHSLEKKSLLTNLFFAKRSKISTCLVRKVPRRISDEFVDLHCGPDGVSISNALTPKEYFEKAWGLVGIHIQSAMDEIDNQSR